jgi:hypothetical protein
LEVPQPRTASHSTLHGRKGPPAGRTPPELTCLVPKGKLQGRRKRTIDY